MSTTVPEESLAAPDPTAVASAIPDENAPNVFDTPAEDTAPAPGSDTLDDVVKQVDERVWKVSGIVQGVVRGVLTETEWEREYVQEPLSYTSMIQFTGLLGRKLDEAMSGDDGLTLQSIMEMSELATAAQGGREAILAQMAAGINVDDDGGAFKGIDSFIRGFAKLASYVPDINDEAMCIWLRIPFRDRAVVREIWSKPPSKGGLSPAEGEEMLSIFIEQNYEELEVFFVERLRRIGKRVQKARKKMHPDA